jgi:hypothetical protein
VLDEEDDAGPVELELWPTTEVVLDPPAGALLGEDEAGLV